MVTIVSKWRIAIVPMALVVFLAIAACSDDETTAPTNTDGALPGAGKVIKIYAAYPMTGPRPEIGADLLTGSQFAVKWINETGGIRAGPLEGATIELTVVDDLYTPEGAGAAATRYLDDSEAFAILSGVSAPSRAVATVLEPRELATISAYGSAKYLWEENKCTFLVSIPGIGLGYATGSFLGSLGKRAVMIAGDESQVDFFIEGARLAAKNVGVEILDDIRYPPGELDFRPTITKAMGANPDVIAIGGTEVEDGNLLLQLREMGWTGPVVDFRGSAYTEAFLDIAGESAVGDFYTTLYADPTPPEGTLGYDLFQAFVTSYGREGMRLAEMHGFDAVITAVAAIEAGAQNRQEMCEFLKKAKDAGREGILGAVEFSELNTPNSRIVAVGRFQEPAIETLEVTQRYEVDSQGNVTTLP